MEISLKTVKEDTTDQQVADFCRAISRMACASGQTEELKGGVRGEWIGRRMQVQSWKKTAAAVSGECRMRKGLTHLSL